MTAAKISIDRLREIFKAYPFVEIDERDWSLRIELYFPDHKISNADLADVLNIINSHPDLSGVYNDFDFWLESGLYGTDSAHFTFELKN